MSVMLVMCADRTRWKGGGLTLQCILFLETMSCCEEALPTHMGRLAVRLSGIRGPGAGRQLETPTNPSAMFHNSNFETGNTTSDLQDRRHLLNIGFRVLCTD
jgi:hypothetical protein